MSLVLILALASGCATRQVDGWYDASLQASIANSEGIMVASQFEPEEAAAEAARTLGAIYRAQYQIDHLAANVGGFERSELDWVRLGDDLLSAYGTLARLSALPAERLALGMRDPDVAAGLEDVRRVIGRWGGAPTPGRGSDRIRP